MSLVHLTEVKLKELFTTARFARCRSRFVIPVLLFETKLYVHWYIIIYREAHSI